MQIMFIISLKIFFYFIFNLFYLLFYTNLFLPSYVKYISNLTALLIASTVEQLERLRLQTYWTNSCRPYRNANQPNAV